jgi:hypothetical protein
VRPSRLEGLRSRCRERHGATPEGACSPQQGATGRLVVPVRPSCPKGFGPAVAGGQTPRRRELAPPSRVSPVVSRSGAAFMARGLRPDGRERHDARSEGACSLGSGVNRRQVALVRPSRPKGFGPAALSGPVPGRRELASAGSVPPTECRTGVAFMARGLRPEGRERHDVRQAGACSCRSSVARRQVALVRPSRPKGFGPAALSGQASGRRELASAGPVPPTECRTRTAFMAKGSRPGGSERPGTGAHEGLLSRAEVSRSCAVLKDVDRRCVHGLRLRCGRSL